MRGTGSLSWCNFRSVSSQNSIVCGQPNREGRTRFHSAPGIYHSVIVMKGGWKTHLKFWKSKSVNNKSIARAPASPAPGTQVHSAGLPTALPRWISGTGFSTGKLNLGEISLVRVTTFRQVWNSGTGQSGASYYNPVDIPQGHHSVGSYGQLNSVPPRGWVLAISGSFDGQSPALAKPTGYTLVWSSTDWADAQQDVLGFFWAPVVPSGYKALGYVITNDPEKPSLDEIVLVREDLTDVLVIDGLLWDTSQLSGVPNFSTWTTKPSVIGLAGTGIPVNTVYCNPALTSEVSLSVTCLKNVNNVLDLMPTFQQLGQILSTYGPNLFFHPEEEYLPTTPQWFFDKGALLYTKDAPDRPVRIATGGSNLPAGGTNDGAYWLDLPNDGTRETVMKGDLSVAKVFIQVKPMFGGIITDFCCWVYYCFNGSSTAKVGVVKSLSLGKIGEHVSDWEHFVLRVDNFSGELRRIYLAAHSGGTWFRPDELEFVAGNRTVVYSSKNTHAMYRSQGDNLQGDAKIGVGLRNDTARSTLILNSSTAYDFMNVDYLGAKGETGYPAEPPWVEFMRQWGPSITYDSKSELEKIVKLLPSLVRKSVMDLLSKLPVELGGEEGPTGPKEKDSWLGDERAR